MDRKSIRSRIRSRHPQRPAEIATPETAGTFGAHTGDPPTSKRGKRIQKNAPRFDARTLLYRMGGVDLTQIECAGRMP